MNWRVRAVLPDNEKEYQTVVQGPTLYHAVDRFVQRLPTLPARRIHVRSQLRAADLLNLHDEDGIKHVPQICAMAATIVRQKDILERSGIPNIKIFPDRTGRWVLFDGHHTLLAYMAVGRKRLRDIPYLIVAPRTSTGRVSDRAARVVFGPFASQIGNWRDYTINWQAPAGQQVTERRQHNMGELYAAIKPFVP